VEDGPTIQEQATTGLSSLSGELRYATPVFLRFEGLDYHNDPEARDKLDRYVRDVQHILDDTRGRMISLEVADKGSVIFAVFGAPVSYGDDSRRAIHATLSFRDLPQRHPYITGQSIGTSRGLLYSGTVGGEVRREYTSMGDETNIASRMMSADRDGRILLSQAVYDDCSEWFEFEKGETVSPKGRVGLVQTYIPLRVKQRVERDLRKTPIVGREKELEQFERMLLKLQRGFSAIVRIEGVAGIGKSRLAAEISHLSQEVGCVVAHGPCLSIGRSVAMYPWRAVLRTLLEIDDGWDDDSIIDHCGGWLAERNENWIPRLPLLGDALGIDLDDTSVTRNLTGTARQQALFSLITEMLYAMASDNPLTIVIEDTHWIDEVSEALLIEVATRLTIQQGAVMLVLLHRPAELSDHPPLMLEKLSDLYTHRHVLLDELSEAAIGEFLKNRLQGIIPPELTRFVFEKTQGNPFFAQEIINVLDESDAVQRIGPRVYIDENLDQLDLPQTVQGLILARLDNLSETEKLIIKLAAVIGRQFEMRVLYQSLPLELAPEDVMDHMRALEKFQLTYLERLTPEPLYAFRHAITQEVTYQTLLYHQRRDWHFNVGTALEALQPDSWERLAHHFVQSDDRDRALLYLIRAGDKTAHEFANQAALSYWGRAIEFVRSQKEEFDLRCKRLEILMRTGNLEEAEHDLGRVVELADATPDNLNWQIRKLRYLAEHALNGGDWDGARIHADLAARLGKSYQDLQLSWETYSIQARIYTFLAQPDLQQAAAKRLRKIAGQLNEPSKVLRLDLNDLLERANNDPDAAFDELEGMYPQIVHVNDLMLEANYWNIVSRISLKTRRLPQAEHALRTQLRLWQQTGNRRMEGNTLHYLGVTQYFLGQYSAAATQFRESYSIFSQVNDRWGESNTLIYLGALAYRRSAVGEGLAYLDRGLTHMLEHGANQNLGEAYFLLGQMILAQKQYAEAKSLFRQSITTFYRSGNAAHIPQSDLGIAFCALHGLTLPLPEDIEIALHALMSGNTHNFHDPDLSFYQAYTLMSFFKQDTKPLADAFAQYVHSRLDELHNQESKDQFLSIGYTRDLMEQFGISV
jgi:class 3 adenylate cyclase/tetratricopeptide (TPR) repeat protein